MMRGSRTGGGASPGKGLSGRVSGVDPTPSLQAAPAIALLLGVLVLTGCGREESGDAPPAGPPPEIHVVVGPGRVEPEGGVLELGTDAGGRVAAIRVAPGDSVAAGDPLVELEQEVERAQVARARAQVETAGAAAEAARAEVGVQEVELAQATRERVRVEALARSDFSTAEALEQARTREESLRARVARAAAQAAVAAGESASARAALALAGAELDRRTIRAPVTGQVLSVGVTVGSILSGFQPVTVVELAPAGPPRVLAEIDELFAHRVRPGQQARIVDPGTGEEVARGEVVFVSPALGRKSLLDDAGGTFEDRRVREIHVRLESLGRLLPGARVEVRVEVGP